MAPSKSQTLRRQFIELLRKNWFVKVRNKRTFWGEIFFPIYSFALFILIQNTTPREVVPAVREYPGLDVFPLSPMLCYVALGTPPPCTMLAYSPNTTDVTNFIHELEIEQHLVGFTKGFASSAAVIQHLWDHPQTVFGAVDIKSLDPFEYTLRTNTTLLNAVMGTSGNFSSFLISGYTSFQQALDQAFINLRLRAAGSAGKVAFAETAQRFPAHKSANIIIGTLWPISMAMAFMFSVQSVIMVIVQEKEDRLKESMAIMGMDIRLYWVSHYLTSFAMMAGLAWGPSHPKVAGAIGVFAIFILGGLYFLFDYFVFTITPAPQWAFHLVSLLSPVTFMKGVGTYFKTELTRMYLDGPPITNLWEGSYPLAYSFIWLPIDAVLYVIIAIYLDSILPSEFGSPKPFYYPCLPRYWCGRKGSPRGTVAPSRYEQLKGRPDAPLIEIRALCKVPPPSQPPSFVPVLPTFSRQGQVVKAVQGLNLDMYGGQILALLGHNGAGKTTTINMLCGMYPPTDGEAYVYGNSITGEMDQVRHRLGVCPQHDVLFPNLTPREHLRLYGALKGMEPAQAAQMAEALMREVMLDQVMDASCTTFSGGMKRKLSLAISLMGDSSVIVLDEPSAGMDPWSRSRIWGLLQARKQSKAIILTTHFMEEAEVLGDRVAVMSGGRLRIDGTPLELKAHFGIGYELHLTTAGPAYRGDLLAEIYSRHLAGAARSPTPLGPDGLATITLTPAPSPAPVGPGPVTPPFLDDVDGTSITSRTPLLQSHMVGERRILSDVHAANEVTLGLPLHGTSRFADLFDEIEARKAELGIHSYTINMSTLEEVTPACLAPLVFLKIAEEEALASEAIREKQRLEEAHRRKKGCACCQKRSSPGDARPPSATSSKSSATPGPAALEQEAFVRMRETLRPHRKPSMAKQVTGPPIPAPLPAHSEIAAMLGEPVSGERTKVNDSIFDGLAVPAHPSPPSLLPCLGRRSCGWRSLSVKAIIRKKLTNFRRDYRVVVGGMVSPLIMIAIIIIYQLSVVNVVTDATPTSMTGISPRGAKTIGMPGMQIPYVAPADIGLANEDPGCLTATQRAGFLGNFTQYNVGKAVLSPQFYPTSNMTYMNDVLAWASDGLSTDTMFGGMQLNNISRPAADSLFYSAHYLYATRNSYSLPVMTGALHEGALRHALRTLTGLNETAVQGASIRSSYAAMPSSINFGVVALNLVAAWLFTQAITMPVVMFAGQIVGEKQTLCKNQILLSGASRLSYWLGNLIADYALWLAMAIVCTVAMVIIQLNCFVATSPAVWIVLLLLHGLVVVLLAYQLSFLFSQMETTQRTLGPILSWICMVPYIVNMVLAGNPPLPVRVIFSMIPVFNVMQSILTMAFQTVPIPSAKYLGWSDAMTSWSEGTMALPLAWIGLVVDVVVLFVCVLYSDRATRFANPGPVSTAVRPLPAGVVDEDVLAEAARLRAPPAPGTPEVLIRMQGLSKIYPSRTPTEAPRVVVNHLTLGINEGECFGLLGPNGAGKTTTCSILTGMIPAAEGSARVIGQDVLDDAGLQQAYKSLGYCAQTNVLWNNLTCREHLRFYARLSGLSGPYVEQAVEGTLAQCDLLKHADKLANELSGGNMRKLCVGIALIGDPRVVFLDEPSTGLDPAARRALWELIKRERDRRCIVLTTHSMAEAEALCSRIGIMVNGSLECLGSAQRLKDKYGLGWTVELRARPQAMMGVQAAATSMAAPPDPAAPPMMMMPQPMTMAQAQAPMPEPLRPRMEALVREVFGPCVSLEKEIKTTFTFTVHGAIQLGPVFRALEARRQAGELEEFSVSQPTLEQVFIRFARTQEEDVQAS
ncbi:putative ATP-binding cassette sub-family A member 1 [Paratrimastix pyriformis]|uniref:ATP-binding cassette sub-family A member 1 n=1 Tax=Paratrimastix pyriformis TaxID=342808 RepID=A0ABQ8UU58_9EUKA|nr:putative ATP-binding cassette sub-family A member 1 [Paratrimastix pyriformis]